MAEVLFNQWIGRLLADVALADTSAHVAPIPRGPGPSDSWRLLMGSEWAIVTHTRDNGDSTATLTIRRGQEGSTATTHRSGQLVRSVLTAAAVAAAIREASESSVASTSSRSEPDPYAFVSHPSERALAAQNFS